MVNTIMIVLNVIKSSVDRLATAKYVKLYNKFTSEKILSNIRVYSQKPNYWPHVAWNMLSKLQRSIYYMSTTITIVETYYDSLSTIMTITVINYHTIALP